MVQEIHLSGLWRYVKFNFVRVSFNVRKRAISLKRTGRRFFNGGKDMSNSAEKLLYKFSQCDSSKLANGADGKLKPIFFGLRKENKPF